MGKKIRFISLMNELSETNEAANAHNIYLHLNEQYFFVKKERKHMLTKAVISFKMKVTE